MNREKSAIAPTGKKQVSMKAERDYYRMVAERLGQKSLADAKEYSRIIHNLRRTEDKLRKSQKELEKKIAQRTDELVRRNEQLRQITARYDELARRIPHGVYTLRTRDGSMRFEYVSPQLCRILGVEPEDLLDKANSGFDLFHPGDRESLMASTCEASRTGAPFCWEGRCNVRGEVRWICIEAESTPAGAGAFLWNGVVSDTTERRLTEEKLRHSEELYRLLNELAPNAITVTDLSGCISVVNPVALRLFGVPRESDAIGRRIFEWVAPESLESAQTAFQELLRQGSIRELEVRLRRGAGSQFTGEVSASLLLDNRGEPKLVIVVVSDITQRKLAEAERLKLQKLEAIGTLAGGIAHDFNNLLQGVFGYITLARLDLDNREATAGLLGEAEAAVTQAVNLTSQLLTFAKGGQPVKQRVLLTKAIKNASRLALSGSGSNCTVALAPDLWEVNADEGQIGQVIQNIVLNASQSMQSCGSVAITAENLVLERGVLTALPDGGDFVRIAVADTGVGIPEQYLTKVFDPYFTTKVKGTGLGLATCYSIVKRHEGAITVASEPGAGTLFSVYLPALRRQPGKQPARAERSAISVVAGNRGAVLVMDDEEMVRNVAGKMIEVCGYRVDLAADGAEAVAKFSQAHLSGTPYDIVLLDLTVRGGMGGEEAIGKIREIDAGVKAIVCSGYSDNPVLSDYRAFGFDAYLSKPYNIDSLKQSLAALVTRR